MSSLSTDETTMLMEQLTAVKMEKYELLEKSKKMVRAETKAQKLQRWFLSGVWQPIQRH